MTNNHFNLLLVDDDVFGRERMAHLIKEEYGDTISIDQANNGSEALNILGKQQVDILVTDIIMKAMNGVELCRKVRDKYPAMKIIVISDEATLKYIRPLEQIGVEGMIDKVGGQSAELTAAIDLLFRNMPYRSASILSLLAAVSKFGKKADIPETTEKERNLVKLLSEGMRMQEIADTLNIGKRSAEGLQSNLMIEFDAKTPAELVSKFKDLGLI